MKHPLKFVQGRGKLADALGIDRKDPVGLEIERIVEQHRVGNKNLQQLLKAVGELDMSDEMWANFLYTFGFWQGERTN